MLSGQFFCHIIYPQIEALLPTHTGLSKLLCGGYTMPNFRFSTKDSFFFRRDQDSYVLNIRLLPAPVI